jgi:hypothetical protein
MNLSLMFESWGINGRPAITINIAHNHKHYPTDLILLDRILRKAYPQSEIQEVLFKHSPVLGSSIIQYLMEVPQGAGEIVGMLTESS